MPARRRWLRACWRVCALVGASWCASSASADGAMVVGDRALFRVGPASREYCKVDSPECPAVLTKVLSSYGYLRGSVQGGFAASPAQRSAWSGMGALHLDAVSAALPGGDMAIARFDGVLSRVRLSRLRLTLFEAQSVFFCRDAQRGSLVLPFVGMTSRQCRPDAVLGLDLRVLRVQWDGFDKRFMAEWLRAGPAFELLQNGLGQAHLLRSVVLAALLDVQSRNVPAGSDVSGTSFGAGLRLSALYRTPAWESRLRVVHRMVLAGGTGFARDQRLEGELRFVRNWFVSDAVVMQTGVSVNMQWASQPWYADALFADRSSRFSLAAGLYVGWVSEAPSI